VPGVLIADDDGSIRLLVRACIGSEGYDVLEAADGDRAWELLRQHGPSVALLDVQMPGRSGLELTRAIRADPGLRPTRVILLTANARPEDVAAGLAGADLYLTKPFSPLELCGAVEAALGPGPLPADLSHGLGAGRTR